MIIKAKKRLTKLLPVIIVVALVIGGFMYLRSRNGVPKVTTTKAEMRTISKTISASGQTDVLEGFTQRALVSGSVKEVKFKSGDTVKKGEVVLELDQASLKASLDVSYSNYLSAKSELDSYNQKLTAAKATESIRKRERDEVWREYMADNGETKKQAYKNAEALYQTALSSLITLQESEKAIKNASYSAYSSYISALNNYQNSTIKSPADGKLALNNIYQGSYVTAGQELFSIISPTNLVFKAEIDEADISHVQVGMKATLNLDSYPGEFFSGTVQNIDAMVLTLPSGSAVVMADIAFNDSNIVPILGLNGSVDIEFNESDSMVSVPLDAIFDELGKKYVYTVVADTVVKKEVEVTFEGDEYVGLMSGISEGDIVVTDVSSFNLTNGQKVNL